MSHDKGMALVPYFEDASLTQRRHLQVEQDVGKRQVHSRQANQHVKNQQINLLTAIDIYSI